MIEESKNQNSKSNISENNISTSKLNKSFSEINRHIYLKLICKIFAWAPAIIIAAFIFGFSSDNGVESSSLSKNAASGIVQFAKNIKIVDVTKDNKEKLIENLQLPIRKAAHMMEYMVFALSVLMALYVWNVRSQWLYIGSFVIAFIFAGTDEFHQLFIPGRSGKFTDVLIDSVGAGIGVLIVWSVRKKKKKTLLRDMN